MVLKKKKIVQPSISMVLKRVPHETHQQGKKVIAFSFFLFNIKNVTVGATILHKTTKTKNEGHGGQFKMVG